MRGFNQHINIEIFKKIKVALIDPQIFCAKLMIIKIQVWKPREDLKIELRMFVGYTVASETVDVRKRITTSVQASIWFFLIPLWQYPLSQRPSPLNSDSGSRPEREGRATALSLAFATHRKLSLACGARNLKKPTGNQTPRPLSKGLTS